MNFLLYISGALPQVAFKTNILIKEEPILFIKKLIFPKNSTKIHVLRAQNARSEYKKIHYLKEPSMKTLTDLLLTTNQIAKYLFNK